MKSSKNIKVYGTLVNHTLDSTLADETHNDALMNAYQLFDGRFGDSPLPNNFQDVINKRITDITFDGGTTTIENRDEVPENHYTLVVNGDTNLNGDVHVTENLHVDGDTYLGDTHVDGDLHVTGDITGINLDDLDDVNVPSPSEKDLLYFLNGLWRSGNISTVYGDDIVNIINNSSQVGWLSKLKDVDIVDRIDGQFLKYNVNGNNAKWMAANITLADIDDIADLLNAADNYVLKFYNGKWRPRPDDSIQFPEGSEGKILKYINGLWVAADDLTGDALPEGSEGKVLKYINGSWVAADDNDTKQLSALNDVTLSTMAVGLVLRYDGSKWTNAKLSLDDLQMPAATAGLVLKFNGTEWVADTDETGGGGATKLSELSDVDSSVDNAADGSVLKYDESSGKWKAVDESSTPSSDGYIYRTQTAHLTKVKSMFVGYEDASRSNSPSTTFGIMYPNNRYMDIYVSNDIVLEDGESILLCLIAELPSERGLMIYNSGVSLMPAEHSWTIAANGESYTWSVDSTHSYSISPGTRKTTTPIKGYSNIGALNRDIRVSSIYINNGVTPPTFSTDPNYDPAKDTSLRSTKHFLYQTSGLYEEVTSKSNYKAAISNDFTFASEISLNGTITRYGVLATGYKERMSSVYPYPWLTTDFYKAVVSDDATRIDYTSIPESEAVSKMTFVDIPYGLCVATFGYDKSCITMPNSLAITVRTRKRAS